MVTIGGEIIRTIQVERIFSGMDREKFRKEQFYKASRAFNGTLKVEDVGQVAIEAAMEVAGLEGAVMVRCLSRPHELEIVSISWPECQAPASHFQCQTPVMWSPWRAPGAGLEHFTVNTSS